MASVSRIAGDKHIYTLDKIPLKVALFCNMFSDKIFKNSLVNKYRMILKYLNQQLICQVCLSTDLMKDKYYIFRDTPKSSISYSEKWALLMEYLEVFSTR